MSTKKLTIMLDSNVYEGLHHFIGRGGIGKFINNLVKPFVVRQDMKKAYKQMAKDNQREKEANEWSEAFINDLKL